MQKEEKDFNQDIIATEEGRNPKWRTKGKGEIFMKDMDDDHLQRAKTLCQNKIFELHKEMCIFTRLEEELDAEATKRNLKLKELDDIKKVNGFFKNNRRFKKLPVENMKQQFNSLSKK
jgi:hypothetical protein